MELWGESGTKGESYTRGRNNLNANYHLNNDVAYNARKFVKIFLLG